MAVAALVSAVSAVVWAVAALVRARLAVVCAAVILRLAAMMLRLALFRSFTKVGTWARRLLKLVSTELKREMNVMSEAMLPLRSL